MLAPAKRTKYCVLVGDGMADYPMEELGGKTPLQAARTPNMDAVASCRLGIARTIPKGMEPGSDVANLALLGYDPEVFHTGRAPLEAASLGVELKRDDVAYRMNLVSLERRDDEAIIMLSHSAGDISTEEARPLVALLKREMGSGDINIHQGVAYRHLLVWKNGPEHAETLPPHDVLDRDMAAYLNRDRGKNSVQDLIRRSWPILDAHPVNAERASRGLKTADSIWLWGQGKAPDLPSFEDRYGLRGGVISAVDLLRGIGVYAGLRPIPVEGATGYLDTNYEGKAAAAVRELEQGMDFIFVHVEAPDEAGHAGSRSQKIEAIERFDSRVVGPVLKGLERFEDYRVMVVSDHFTPIAKRTHSTEPIPFAWARGEDMEIRRNGPGFEERAAEETGLFFDKGSDLLSSFIGFIESS